MGSKQVASGEPIWHELHAGVLRVVRLGLNLKVVERWLSRVRLRIQGTKT
jgi:hypothetical protein